jgi:hypothetical protein
MENKKEFFMKTNILVLIAISFLLPGCLTFHRISYELTLEDNLGGKGIITVYDIRSNAETENNFEDDKNILFGYMLESDEFLSEMIKEGKDITSRNLFVEDNLLNGEVEFYFSDIRRVEGIAYEDGFYYLTMDIADSIYSTNGEVIFSEDYKRIVWGSDVETLKFEMVAVDYDDSYYRELAPYYKE